MSLDAHVDMVATMKDLRQSSQVTEINCVLRLRGMQPAFRARSLLHGVLCMSGWTAAKQLPRLAGVHHIELGLAKHETQKMVS
eukprot:scaffold313000_cov36-Tisochrysis_lutea.AAC.3